MRLTKVAEHQQQPAVATMAPAAATGSKFVLVLSDVEGDPADDPLYGKTGVPCTSRTGLLVRPLKIIMSMLCSARSTDACL